MWPAAAAKLTKDTDPELIEAAAQVFGAATVTALREIALDLQPSLKDDLDHLIAQLHELSDEYLRAIGSDAEGMCDELGVVAGQVGWVTAAELAKGTLDDRHRDDDKGTEWWKLVATAALTVIGMLIVQALT